MKSSAEVALLKGLEGYVALVPLTPAYVQKVTSKCVKSEKKSGVVFVTEDKARIDYQIKQNIVPLPVNIQAIAVNPADSGDLYNCVFLD